MAGIPVSDLRPLCFKCAPSPAGTSLRPPCSPSLHCPPHSFRPTWPLCNPFLDLQEPQMVSAAQLVVVRGAESRLPVASGLHSPLASRPHPTSNPPPIHFPPPAPFGHCGWFGKLETSSSWRKDQLDQRHTLGRGSVPRRPQCPWLIHLQPDHRSFLTSVSAPPPVDCRKPVCLVCV